MCHFLQPALDLFDLYFRVSLPVALLTFVLFAAFLLKYDDFFSASVADDCGGYGRCTDLTTYNQRLDVKLLSGFGVDRRHAKCLARFDRELFTACFYDR